MNRHQFLRPIIRLVMVLAFCGFLSACVGTVVGAVVDTAIEVAKVPFKVGGAVIDVATPDKKKKKHSDLDSDLENEGE